MHITIYALINPKGVYVGSTKRPLKYRLNEHRNVSNDCYSKIFNGVFSVKILEEFDCKYATTMFLKELWYIDNTEGCINNNRPFICLGMGLRKLTIEQRRRRCRRNYYKDVEASRAKDRERNVTSRIHCVCGGYYARRNRLGHQRTQRHKAYESILVTL